MRKHKETTQGEERRVHKCKKMQRSKKEGQCLCAIIGRGVYNGVRLPYVLLLSKAGGLQEGFKGPQQHHKAPGGRGLPSRGLGREGKWGEGQAGQTSYSDQDPFPARALEFFCSCHRSPFPYRLNPSLPHAQ